MRFVGLTGGFGSGKSLVANLLEEEGAVIIDADQLARDVVVPGEAAYQKIVTYFGTNILLENGEINRKGLAEIVFNDSEKLAQLNAIVHGEIEKKRNYLSNRYMQIKHIDIVVYSAPLLFENQMNSMFQKVVLVTISEETRMKRLMQFRNFSRDEILARLKHQLTQEEKIQRADYLIDNEGSVENTKEQTKKIFRQLQQLPKYSPATF